MVDFQYADLFKKDSVDKQLQIAFDSGTITNTELHQGQFELNESLCSEENLRFGSCEASSIKFKISNIFTPLTGKWLTVTETLDGNTDVSFSYGKYKVYSDKPTADRRYRDVTAYDAMYDILTADVTGWYNTILPEADSTVTLKEFRDSFFAYFGIAQEEVTLVNDSMVVAKTIEPSKISGQTVITAICEINGCFGHIGRDGRFQYIHLKEMTSGLYPSATLYPREDLYPAAPRNAELISGSCYIRAEHEDYTTERIDKLQIRQEDDDIGCIYGDGENCYIVQDNFLVYGKSSEELQAIAANLYSVICKIWYRPAHVEAKGNPCLEVGDGIRLATKYEIVYTYILQRTLKGIQALRDTYDADGEQYQGGDANGMREQIIQLKGKANKLSRTIEETRLEMTDLEKGLSNKIKVTAEGLTEEITRAKGAEESLSTTIKVTAEGIKTEVAKTVNTWETKDYEIAIVNYGEPDAGKYKPAEYSGKYYLDQTTGKLYKSDGNVWNYVEQLEKLSESLKSAITQTAGSITLEVKRATEAEGNLASQISINAQNILLKVSKDGIISAINQSAEQIAISASKIKLEGAVTANDYFKINTDGSMEAKAGRIANMVIKDYHMYWDYGSTSAGISALSHGSAFWAGASFDNRDNAPFRVWHDGTVLCKKLEAEQYTKTDELSAKIAEFGYVKTDELEADYIKTNELSSEVSKLGYATAESLNAAVGRIDTLETNSITSATLASSIANISGVISVNNGLTCKGIADFTWIQYNGYHLKVEYVQGIGYVVMADDETSAQALALTAE